MLNTITRGTRAAPRARARVGLSLDRFEVAALAGLVLLSTAPLLWLAWRASVHDLVWVGTDAGDTKDELMYLAWIREAGEHLLISNRYRSDPTNAIFLHPGLSVSGALNLVGLPASVAYLVWKPVAIVGLFVAARAYVRRLLRGRAARRSALVIALFFLAPASILAGRVLTGPGTGGLSVSSVSLWPVHPLWGYYFAGLAIAALAAALLAYERDRTDGRVRPWAPLLGFLCAWLHPWQGATLIAILVGTEAVLYALARSGHATGAPAEAHDGIRPLVRRLLPSAAAITAPLVYYTALARFDSSWETAQKAYAFFSPAWWTVALAIAPLALPALLAYRSVPRDFQGVAVRVWPLVALALLWAIADLGVGSFAPHAIQGMTIPLAVLAVTGLQTIRWPLPRWAVAAGSAAAIALLIVPSTALEVRDLFRKIDEVKSPYLTSSERDALRYLDRSSVSGAVFAPQYLGQFIPAQTGRRTSIGHPFWTPDYSRRTYYANALFGGRLPAEAVRVIVRSSDARYVLSGCADGASLTSALRPMLLAVDRFGCATVYELESATGTRADVERSRLVRGSERDVIVLSSGRIPVSDGPAVGYVEKVTAEGGKLTVSGWAVNRAESRPADYVLVFAGDRPLVAGEPLVTRSDIRKEYGESSERSGFRLTAADPEARRLARSPELRAFAIAGDRGVELEPLDSANAGQGG